MKLTLIRPIITEKTLTLASRGWYTFMVDKKADKGSIARVISDFYKVKVLATRVISVHGKVRRVGKLMKSIQKPNWKKALIRLGNGQKIDAFEIAPTEEGAKV